MIRHLLFAWLLACAAGGAFAHKPSDSYLRLAVDGPRISGQWDLALRDLEYAIGLDADGDGAISWGELRARHAEIAAYALARVALDAGGAACPLRATEHLVDDHSDGAYAVMKLAGECAAAPGALRIRYTLFADTDPLHRGLFSLSAGGSTRSAVLDPAAGAQTFELNGAGAWETFGQFLREGVWHIWIGFDHILFLMSLLLPAVLVRRASIWQPAATLRESLIDVVKVITAFTVAHSITLSLAALGSVSLPSAMVESAIAISVVLAALNNLFPLFQRGRWMVAFGFGLIHGFGFASVLADLGLPQHALALALVAFNVGVELGQLAIVVVFVPVAFALRSTLLYRRAVLAGGSWAIAALATVWFVERTFGLEILKL
jgi:hypothetical protein